jgi:tRNA (guanine-N7-)-methyltransferase
MIDPEQFVISRKRKKYRFALFANNPLCFEDNEWPQGSSIDVLEVGAGTGLFSVLLAEKSLGTHYVAVDVKGDRLQKGAYAAEEKSLRNVQFLRARADQLPELMSSHLLASIWVTFPDPFPRPRSAGRRLTHATFLRIYQRLLTKDGALYFKTDARDLFTWSLEQLVREGWRIEELSFDLHESDLSAEYKITTTYERRFIAEGLKTHFVKATPPENAPTHL